MCAFLSACMCACMCAFVSACVCACMCAFMCLYGCVYVYAYGCVMPPSLVTVANACKCCHLANAYKIKERYIYSDTNIHT